MLRSVLLAPLSVHGLEAVQQHLEAAARTAADLRAGRPFEIVLCVHDVREGLVERLDAAIRSAGGGKVGVRWKLTRVQLIMHMISLSFPDT